MTKANFLWCLVRTKGTVRLYLRSDGDGWVCACHRTILCTAELQTPSHDFGGVAVGSLHKNTFVVAGFQGGDLGETERNDRCVERAEVALQKYSRWAAEALGKLFDPR